MADHSLTVVYTTVYIVPQFISSLLSEIHNFFRFFQCILEVLAVTVFGLVVLIAIGYELSLKRRA